MNPVTTPEDNLRTRCDKVRSRLTEYRLTNIWLVSELERRGFLVTPTVLCDILGGNRRSEKAHRTIEKAEMILDKYQKMYYEN